MTKLVDLHIGSTRPELLSRALDSIPEWMEVHVLYGMPSVFDLRDAGFRLGSCKYVTYLDDDDFYLPDIERVKPYLEEGKLQALYTDSVRSPGEAKLSLSKVWPHNPIFYERSFLYSIYKGVVDSLTSYDLRQLLDTALRNEIAALGKWNFLPVVAYNWTRTPGSVSQNRSVSRVQAMRYLTQHLPQKILPINILPLR